MKHSVFLASKKNEQRTIKGLLLLVALLAISTVLSLVITVTRHTHTKTIVLPASVTAPFWITDGEVSENYLADMGDYVLTKFLTLTEGNAPIHRQTLLQLTAPEAHANLDAGLSKQFSSVKQGYLSLHFVPEIVDADTDTLTATVTGKLTRYTAQHLLDATTVTYRVTFRLERGRLWLTGVSRVNDGEMANDT